MKYLDPSFSVPMQPDTSHPKAGDWEEIFKMQPEMQVIVDGVCYDVTLSIDEEQVKNCVQQVVVDDVDPQDLAYKIASVITVEKS